MKDLERARSMKRVLLDACGEGKSAATMARNFGLSEQSIRTVLGIKPEPEPEAEPKPAPRLARLRKRLGF